jgi:hypothetical protein
MCTRVNQTCTAATCRLRVPTPFGSARPHRSVAAAASQELPDPMLTKSLRRTRNFGDTLRFAYGSNSNSNGLLRLTVGPPDCWENAALRQASVQRDSMKGADSSALRSRASGLPARLSMMGV